MKRKTFNLKVLLLASALVFSNINAVQLGATTIQTEDSNTLVAKKKSSSSGSNKKSNNKSNTNKGKKKKDSKGKKKKDSKGKKGKKGEDSGEGGDKDINVIVNIPPEYYVKVESNNATNLKTFQHLYNPTLEEVQSELKDVIHWHFATQYDHVDMDTWWHDLPTDSPSQKGLPSDRDDEIYSVLSGTLDGELIGILRRNSLDLLSLKGQSMFNFPAYSSFNSGNANAGDMFKNTLIHPKDKVPAYMFIMNMYKVLGMPYRKYVLTERSRTPQDKLGGMDRDNEDLSVVSVSVDRSNPQRYIEKFRDSNPVHARDFVKVPKVVYDDSAVYTPSDNDNVFISRKTAYLLAWDILQDTSEPTLSELEQNVIINHYAYDIPVGLDDEEFTAWRELITRGIIDPSDVNKDLSLSDMLELLDKCANKEKRTNLKQVTLTLDAAKVNPFISKGYVNAQADVEVENNAVDISFIDGVTNNRYVILDFSNLKGYFKKGTDAYPLLKRSTLFIRDGEDSIKRVVKGKNIFAVRLKSDNMYVDGYPIILSADQANTGKVGQLKGRFLVFRISNGREGFKDVYTFNEKSIKSVVANNKPKKFGDYKIIGSYRLNSSAQELTNRVARNLGIRIDANGNPLGIGEDKVTDSGSLNVDVDYEEEDEDDEASESDGTSDDEESDDNEDTTAFEDTSNEDDVIADVEIGNKVYAMNHAGLVPLDGLIAITNDTAGSGVDSANKNKNFYYLSLGFNTKDTYEGILSEEQLKQINKGNKTVSISSAKLKEKISDILNNAKKLNVKEKNSKTKKYDLQTKYASIKEGVGASQNNGYGKELTGDITLPGEFTYVVKVLSNAKTPSAINNEKKALAKIISKDIKFLKSSKFKPASGTASGGASKDDTLAYDNINAYLGTSSDRAGFYIKISDDYTSSQIKSAIDGVVKKIEKPKDNVFVLTMANSEVIVIDNEKKFVYRTSSIFDYSFLKSEEKLIDFDGKSMFIRAEVLYGLLGMSISSKPEKAANGNRLVVTISYSDQGLSHTITPGGDGSLGLVDLNGMKDDSHRYRLDANYIYFNDNERTIAYLPLTQSLSYLPFLLYFGKGDGGTYGKVITFRTLTDGSSKVEDKSGILKTAPKGFSAKVTDINESATPKQGTVIFNPKYGPVYVVPQGNFDGIPKAIEKYKKGKYSIPVYFINAGTKNVIQIEDPSAPQGKYDLNHSLQILNYNYVKYGNGGTPVEFNPFDKNKPSKNIITTMFAAPTNMLAYYAPWRMVYDLNTTNTGTEAFYFGTDPVTKDDDGTLISTMLGKDSGVKLDKLFSDKAKSGLIRQYRDMQYSPSKMGDKFFYQDLNVDLTKDKEASKKDAKAFIEETIGGIQDFFSKFSDLQLTDLINNGESWLTITYYIITRIIPIILFVALVLILIISVFSDMGIMKMFAEKIIDPVKILTLGKYSLQSIKTTRLFIQIIIAATLMGCISLGLVEKLIVFGLRWVYAFLDYTEFLR